MCGGACSCCLSDPGPRSFTLTDIPSTSHLTCIPHHHQSRPILPTLIPHHHQPHYLPPHPPAEPLTVTTLLQLMHGALDPLARRAGEMNNLARRPGEMNDLARLAGERRAAGEPRASSSQRSRHQSRSWRDVWQGVDLYEVCTGTTRSSRSRSTCTHMHVAHAHASSRSSRRAQGVARSFSRPPYDRCLPLLVICHVHQSHPRVPPILAPLSTSAAPSTCLPTMARAA